MGNEAFKSIITVEEFNLTSNISSIHTPYATKQRQAFFEREPNQTHARLIHYTTAESTLNIIKTWGSFTG